MKPKTQVTKIKIEELDFIKMKNFCASNGTINRERMRLRKWEKIFANTIANKD